MDIIGKLNSWTLPSNAYPNTFSALIIKETLNGYDFFYIVARPFYSKIDDEKFSSTKELEEYYKSKLEVNWKMEFIYPYENREYK